MVLIRAVKEYYRSLFRKHSLQGMIGGFSFCRDCLGAAEVHKPVRFSVFKHEVIHAARTVQGPIQEPVRLSASAPEFNHGIKVAFNPSVNINTPFHNFQFRGNADIFKLVLDYLGYSKSSLVGGGTYYLEGKALGVARFR